MAFPVGVETVICTVPYAVSAFDGDVATMHVTMDIVTSVGAIIWMETGQELTQMVESKFSNEGDVTFETPVCDQEGWGDSAGHLNPKWSVLVTSWYVIEGKEGARSFHWFRPLEVDAVDGINLGQLPDGSISPAGSTDYDPYWAEETEFRKAGDAIIEATKIDGLNGVTGLWAGSQVEYDALTNVSPTVVYIVD